MTKKTMPARLSAMIAAFFLLVASGAVSAQGGGSGGAPSGGGGVSGGGSSSAPKPAASKPAGTGESTSGKPSGTTSRTGTVHGSESGTDSSQVTSVEKEFESWLATSKEGSRLGDVYERLRNSAAPALMAGVPIEAFKARIREAAAKGAAPEIVAAAIEADAMSWIWLANLVKAGTWPPAKTAAGFYLATASALRNGLGETAVRDLVVWCADLHMDPERAGAALTGAVSLSATLGTRGSPSDSVARLLAASKLRIGQYDSVTALANRALAAGISAERFMATLQETLGMGKNLSGLEKALFP